MNTNNGWQLVPVVPTEEMEAAAVGDYEQSGGTFPRWKSAYAAMLAAAPAAPGSPASTVADEGAKSSGLEEAQRLAQALFQRHFSQDDDYVSGRVKWEVLDDLPGVLSQIDNMVSGLVQPAAPAAGDALSDPALQKLFGEVITGALGFGAQGVNPPPAGHWLEPFWKMARADAALANSPTILDHPLLREVLGYIEDAGPADVWGAAQAWMALRDAALSASQQGGE